MARRHRLPAALLVLSTLLGAGGCSSSSSSQGAADSGASDGSLADDGGLTTDDGGNGLGDGGPPTDSGASEAGEGGARDASFCTAASTVPTPPAYVAATPRSACSHADVSSFLAACAMGTPATCQTWFGTAANVTCAACMRPAPLVDGGLPAPTGGLLFDDFGVAHLNVPACLAIVQGSSTCAAPVETLTICEGDACGSLACQDGTPAEQSACTTAADKGVCAAALAAANGACVPAVGDGGVDGGGGDDGGALDGAAEGGGAAAVPCDGTTAAGAAGVLYTICGNGS